MIAHKYKGVIAVSNHPPKSCTVVVMEMELKLPENVQEVKIFIECELEKRIGGTDKGFL